jgi:hypothetical protein
MTKHRVAEALDQYGLVEVAGQAPPGLPLGIRQRLQLAAACLNVPLATGLCRLRSRAYTALLLLSCARTLDLRDAVDFEGEDGTGWTVRNSRSAVNQCSSARPSGHPWVFQIS